jgi:Tol biopolymer transport system component/DNA-binding winged helix-turn-helix (wHTH) protein
MDSNFQPDRQTLNHGFRVGAYDVYPQLNRLVCGQTAYKVERKIMLVLLCLAEQSGAAVTREQIMDRAWPNTFVGDDVLSRSISRLRKIFGDDPGRQIYIETIPKIGYRLVAPIRSIELEEESQVKAERAGPAVNARKKIGFRIGLAMVTAAVVGATSWFIYIVARKPEKAAVRISSLMSFAGREGMPTISPDGEWAAFVKGNAEEGDQDIYLKRIGEEQPVRLTSTPATEYRPAFSPGGDQIAFVRSSAEGCGIYVISRAGGPERKLTECAADFIPALAWSGDGQWIAYSDRNDRKEPYAIYLLSPTKLEKHRLTDPPAQGYGDNDLAFSPDGTSMAFARATLGTAEDIYIISLNGGAPKRLTEDQRKITGLTWNAAGSGIIYATDRGGNFGLWKVAASGGAPEWTALGGQLISAPALSRSGTRLIYEQATYDANIWRMDISSLSSPTPVINSSQWEWAPQYSPDGKTIAFVSESSGDKEIWLCRADGSEPRRLTNLRASFLSNPRWAPDGRSIAFEFLLGTDTDIYLIDANGGTPRRLTDEPSNESAPNWSHDGKWIYFSSNRSGAQQVWKMPAAGGKAEQVTEQGGHRSLESPDGKELFFTKPQQAGLWRIPVGGGPETIILDSLSPQDSFNWELTARGIFFIQREEIDSPTLAFYDFAMHRIKPITPLVKYRNYYGLSVSPDGRWLLYSQLDRFEGDIMLLDNFRP